MCVCVQIYTSPCPNKKEIDGLRIKVTRRNSESIYMSLSLSQLDRVLKAKTRAMAFQSDAINCPFIPSVGCVLVVSYGISIE